MPTLVKWHIYGRPITIDGWRWWWDALPIKILLKFVLIAQDRLDLRLVASLVRSLTRPTHTFNHRILHHLILHRGIHPHRRRRQTYPQTEPNVPLHRRIHHQGVAN